jgi:hypothetical protein
MMKHRLLSAAIASIGMSTSRGYSMRSWAAPCVPLSPLIAKVRKCAQCKIGILSGRHCFACTQSKRK